jgi:hypothetical protein
MKNIITFCITLLFAGLLQAQNRTEIELFKAQFNKEKMDLVAEFMDLFPKESEAFWPIYKKYETERSVVASERIRLLNQYVENYENLTNDQAAYWSKDVIKLQEKELKIKKKYNKLFGKATSPQLTLRFFQFEEALQTEIKSLIMKNIPVLDNY